MKMEEILVEGARVSARPSWIRQWYFSVCIFLCRKCASNILNTDVATLRCLTIKPWLETIIECSETVSGFQMRVVLFGTLLYSQFHSHILKGVASNHKTFLSKGQWRRLLTPSTFCVILKVCSITRPYRNVLCENVNTRTILNAQIV